MLDATTVPDDVQLELFDFELDNTTNSEPDWPEGLVSPNQKEFTDPTKRAFYNLGEGYYVYDCEDDLQWIVARKRKDGRSRHLGFVTTTRDIVARILCEKHVPHTVVQKALELLPQQRQCKRVTTV